MEYAFLNDDIAFSALGLLGLFGSEQGYRGYLVTSSYRPSCSDREGSIWVSVSPKNDSTSETLKKGMNPL